MGIVKPQPRMSTGAGQGRRSQSSSKWGEAQSTGSERWRLGGGWLGAGKRQTHPTALRKVVFGPFLAESRLSHRLLAASLIFFPPNGNNLQD